MNYAIDIRAHGVYAHGRKQTESISIAMYKSHAEQHILKLINDKCDDGRCRLSSNGVNLMAPAIYFSRSHSISDGIGTINLAQTHTHTQCDDAIK